MSAKEIIDGESTAVAPAPRGRTPAVTPMQMLQTAVEQGANLDMMSKLMDLQERWEANEARKAFVAALSAFKADPPVIRKNKNTSFTSRRTGDTTEYDYLTLPEAVRLIAPALSEHGLSHTWTVAQADSRISVTCVLTHKKGHSESVTLSGPADDSGAKNPIQQIASTVTYLERYSLLAITGLSAGDMDDDGSGADGESETISEDQIRDLEDLMTSVDANVNKFLAWANVEKLADLKAEFFPRAVSMLKAKGEKK